MKTQRTIQNGDTKKFNWRKLILDIIKVAIGAAAGWFGTGL